MPTTVVNVRGKTDADLEAIPGFVYVGRRVLRSKLACAKAGSPFGNPFMVPRDGVIEAVLDKYRRHVLATPNLVSLLPTLRGKALGCWCCDWSPDNNPALFPERVCHAQVLAELADGPLGEPDIP